MSRYFHCLAFLATVTISTIANAEPIFDQHIKAVGGADKIATIKTIQRSGTVSLVSLLGTLDGSLSEAYDVAGSKGHRIMDLFIFRIESGWIGDEGWQNGPFEGLRNMDEGELAMAKLDGGASILSNIKKTHGMAAFKEPADKSFNGKDCVLLAISVQEARLEFYIDKDTKLLEGMQIYDTGGPETLKVAITFENYKAVDGIQFAQKVTTDVPEQEVTIVKIFNATELNDNLDDTKFAKPEPAMNPEDFS